MNTRVGLLIVTALALAGLTHGADADQGGPLGSLEVGAERSPAGIGSKIAFTRLRQDVSSPDNSELLEAEIWVMNGNGADPRQVTFNTTDDLGAVWSPNGHTIAFYATQFAPDASGELVATGPPHIYLIDADGGPQTVLTDSRARWPSWSPNGKQIAFDNGGPTAGDILTINADGSGEPVNLTASASARNIRPDWSPNGRKIAFTSRRDGDDEIWVMNADGTDPIQLTDNGALDNAANWSPNGRKILFQSNRDGNDEVYVMNHDGTGQTRLTNHPGRDLDPDWSPNGSKIAFERDIEPIQKRIVEVFTMNADGTEQTPLTALPTENGHPAWNQGTASAP